MILSSSFSLTVVVGALVLPSLHFFILPIQPVASPFLGVLAVATTFLFVVAVGALISFLATFFVPIQFFQYS